MRLFTLFAHQPCAGDVNNSSDLENCAELLRVVRTLARSWLTHDDASKSRRENAELSRRSDVQERDYDNYKLVTKATCSPLTWRSRVNDVMTSQRKTR
ncbi:hypothetical protein NP493_53g08185 [Ridgeia piscesae]|uniref:Uncharacterized protein n=1 Tax=Ridgeia piscesae TaxID=27915 RepID=A0AAD9PB59_RIDPI|nr:hypothetical protein NP493_53g08185 [Ridgeia piscesae]